jgi:hypothetical protein
VTNGATRCECPDGYKGDRCDIGYSSCENGGCDFREVRVAHGGVCAIHADERVECWGEAASESRSASTLSAGHVGFCGIDPTSKNPWCTRAIRDLPATPVDVVALGRYHACASRQGGTTCWWLADLPFRPNTPELLLPPPNSDFVSLTASVETTCGIRADGSLACWGENDFDTAQSGIAYAEVAIGGRENVCALRSDQTIECFSSGDLCQYGSDTYRSLALGFNFCVAVRTDGSIYQYNWAAPPIDGTYTQISAKEDQVCAVATDGTVACWGGDNRGAVLPRRGPFVDAARGPGGICAIRPDRTLDCWSANGEQMHPPWGEFRKVAVGYSAACALDVDGKVTCFNTWGFGVDPASAPPDERFLDIGIYGEFGGDLICGVTSDHQIRCWGGRTPLQAPPQGEYEKISVAADTTCAITTTGEVRCWGSVQPALPGDTFKHVSAGRSACGLKVNGDVQCSDASWDSLIPPGPHEDVCVQTTSNGTSILFLKQGTILSTNGTPTPGFLGLGCSPVGLCRIRSDQTLTCK